MSQEPPRRRSSNNPYRTVSASERRAQRKARQGTSDTRAPAERAQTSKALSQDVIYELLHNPTKTVTEAELRSAYGFVVADLRSMGLLALGLVVLLFVLAATLPR